MFFVILLKNKIKLKGAFVDTPVEPWVLDLTFPNIWYDDLYLNVSIPIFKQGDVGKYLQNHLKALESLI